jgi:flagellum-specific peptidoglycan hydrolase FlgJ
MRNYRIPASITLAQAILESGSGQSKLAKNGRNHFGIKCTSDWNGRTILEDDDKKDECFRKYRKAKHSFRDHSEFLANKKRYAFLFELDKRDYKAWANGLKKAGYATNPNYPTLLINLIEKYNLEKYDKRGARRMIRKEERLEAKK